LRDSRHLHSFPTRRSSDLRLACGPTVAPFGPQSVSLKTPVLVAASKALITTTGTDLPSMTTVEVEAGRLFGSTISNPPWQKVGPPNVQPDGLLAICGTDV